MFEKCIKNISSLFNTYEKSYFSLQKRVVKKLLAKLRIEDRENMTNLRNLQLNLTGFRKWCLGHYTSPKLGITLFWVMLLNIVPIAGEIVSLFLEKMKRNSRQRFEQEFVTFEALNGVAMLFYVFDAFVGVSTNSTQSRLVELCDTIIFL